MKYYVKNFVFCFLYLLMSDVVAICVISIDSISYVARLILAIINTLLFCTVMVFTGYHEGKNAMKALFSNDIKRRRIVETGEDIPLEKHEEYNPHKGFLMGLSVTAPLIICLILHLILGTSSNGELATSGRIGGMAYIVFLAPFIANNFVTGELVVWTTYFYTAYAVIALPLSYGIPYIVGSKRMKKEYDKIEKKQKLIYGDKN